MELTTVGAAYTLMLEAWVCWQPPPLPTSTPGFSMNTQTVHAQLKTHQSHQLKMHGR